MDGLTKAKEWINENAPMLAKTYENKYVGMLYDRFASLPPSQQKNLILGTMASFVTMILVYLLSSYFSLWSTSSKTSSYGEMVNLLLQYQRDMRDKNSQIQKLEGNGQIATPGAFKRFITDQARSAGISQKMVEVEEKPESGSPSEDGKAGSSDVKVKHASVVLQRINLNQLKSFLQYIEFGRGNLSVVSIKVTNDDKIRGYMRAAIDVVAYVFRSDESGS